MVLRLVFHYVCHFQPRCLPLAWLHRGIGSAGYSGENRPLGDRWKASFGESIPGCNSRVRLSRYLRVHPSCASVNTPISYNSITAETVAPKEIGSMPCSLHRKFTYVSASRSFTPFDEPKAQAASYSIWRKNARTPQNRWQGQLGDQPGLLWLHDCLRSHFKN